MPPRVFVRPGFQEVEVDIGAAKQLLNDTTPDDVAVVERRWSR